MVRRRSSRLAKKEDQRLMRQSVLLLIVTGIIVLGLIIWGVPALSNFAGFLGEVKTSTQPIEGEDSLAPFAPQLDLQFDATASARIDISGFAEAGSTVVLFNNGQKVSEVVVDDQGEFEFVGVALDVGENEFSAGAIDLAGNESPQSEVRMVMFDNVPPELVIDSPENDSEVSGQENDSVVVTGVSEFGVSVYVAGRLVAVGSDGSFSQRVRLSEGDNVISVVAIDRAGNTSSKEIELKYLK